MLVFGDKVIAMNWQDFTAFLVLATAMSFSPGPNTTLSTALAANGGLRHAMRFVWAVPVGWSLLLLLCAAGVGGPPLRRLGGATDTRDAGERT